MPTSLNKRVFYPTHLFGLGPFQSTTYTSPHGAQQIGVNTNFSIENIQELGQLEIYQIVEQIPEIEVTSEKVLDGYPLLMHLSTQGAPDATLVGRSNQRCGLVMNVYGDSQSSASGTPSSQIECSGLYWSQSSFTFTTDGTFKESWSAVGNNKVSKVVSAYAPNFTNTDSPLSLSGSGGVNIRKDMIFYPILTTGTLGATQERTTTLDVNNQLSAFLTILPPDIQGISSSGTNDRDSGGNFAAHLTSITTSVNLGRDAILELGRKEPYFRFITFPIQVTTEIAQTATEADTVNATELGSDGAGNNLVNRTIRLRAREGTFINLGTKNKLQSVSFQGGGTDGGQVTTTYSYLGYNTFTVTHPSDPGNYPWPY